MSKQNMTTIDPNKLRTFVEEKGVENVTSMIGKAPGYFHNVYARESMPTSVLNAMCTIFDVSPADIKPDPPKPPLAVVLSEPLPYKSEPPVPKSPMPSIGYALDLRVYPAFVSLALYDDSKLLKFAKAKIKNGEKASRLDIVQAISYAAHMLYKFMEQDDIR